MRHRNFVLKSVRRLWNRGYDWSSSNIVQVLSSHSAIEYSVQASIAMSGLILLCLIVAVIAGIVRSHKLAHVDAHRQGEKYWLNPSDGILAGSDIPIYSIENKNTADNKTTITIEKMEFVAPAGGKSIHIKLHDRDNISTTTIGSSAGSDDSIVYPQILVVVDYETFKLHGQNVERLVEYLLAFWNGVDLKFRGLVFPKVRLNIAGILIARHTGAVSFISKNKDSSDVVNGEAALGSFTEVMKHVRRSFRPIKYDIAVAMHPYTTRGRVTGSWKIIPYGFGSISARVAMIQDKGGFNGIINAARQLGRLFGATFDQHEGTFCSADHGYILSQTANKRLHWSDCSLQAFDDFFHSKRANHLLDKPKTRSPLPRLLPGRLLTADQQCEKTIGSKADQSRKKYMCVRLHCMNEPWAYLREQVRFPAADGTVCDTGKICLDGQCVNDPEL